MAICGTAFLCLALTGVTPAENSGHAGIRWQPASLSTAGSAPSAGAAPGLAFQGSTAAIAQDASQVQFSIYGGKLYFRNLHAFNPEWAGCCYNYFIDLTSDDGKSMYAYFMLQYANRGRIVLWKESVAPGPIQQMGNWS